MKLCHEYCKEPICSTSYVYRRYEKLSGEDRVCVFVLLNPKNLDGSCDTVDNCRAVAEKNKCGSMIIVNLCAIVAEDNEERKKHSNLGILRPEYQIERGDGTAEDIKNKKCVESALSIPNALIIVGWGSASVYNATIALKEIIDNKPNLKIELNCLALNKDEEPIHLSNPLPTPIPELEKFCIKEIFPKNSNNQHKATTP